MLKYIFIFIKGPEPKKAFKIPSISKLVKKVHHKTLRICNSDYTSLKSILFFNFIFKRT